MTNLREYQGPPIEERNLVRLKSKRYEQLFKGRLKMGEAYRVIKLAKNRAGILRAWIGPTTMSEADMQAFEPKLLDQRDKRFFGEDGQAIITGVTPNMLQRLLD